MPCSHVTEHIHEELEHLGQRDHRYADPEAELTTDIAEQLAARVVGALLGLQHVRVAHVHVQPREVRHRRTSVFHVEILAVQGVLLPVGGGAGGGSYGVDASGYWRSKVGATPGKLPMR